MESAKGPSWGRSSILQFVPERHHERLSRLFRTEKFVFGDLIVREGEPADAFYILRSGRARVLKTAPDGSELRLNMLSSGDEFGESALLAGGVRTASVRCSTAVEVDRLDRQSFVDLVTAYPEFRNYLELSARWHTLRSFLYEFSNFGRLPKAVLQALIEKLEPVDFAKGDLIIRAGDPPGPMYIIQSGRVRIVMPTEGTDRNRRFLREGDFFGELSVVLGAPRSATAEALSPCRLLALSPEAIRDLRDRHPEFARLLEERRAVYDVEHEARVPLDFAEEILPSQATPAPPLDLDESAAASGEDPFADEAGRFRRRHRRIRRWPFVAQIDEMDCGAACVAMVCRHFGRRVSLPRIRQLCHTSTDGTSLRALCEAATHLGLAARALKVSRRLLSEVPLPAIVHWEGNHWIVLFDVRARTVRVADPALGVRTLSRQEFDQKWSGYAALFDYTESFEQAPEGGSILRWLWPFLRAHQVTLLQTLGLAGVASVLQLLFPVLTQVVVDQVLVDRSVDLLRVTVAGLVVAGVFMLGTTVLQQYLLSYIAVRVDTGMLDALTRQLLALPMAYFHRRRTGDIQRRLEGARELRNFVVQHGIGSLLAVVQLVGCTVLMALYSPPLFALFLLTLPAYGALMYFSFKVLRPVFSDLEEAHGRYSSHQVDAIKGIEAVKAAGAEQAFRDNMLNEFVGYSRRMLRGNFVVMTYENLIQFVSLLSTALFLLVGAHLVLDGQITIGVFVAFNALLAMAYAALLRALGVWDEFQMMVVLQNRLLDIFEQEPEQGRDRSQLRSVPTLEGHIELRQVGFRYGGPESVPILQDVSLTIPPGRSVAIVGRSGSGKTTLVKLLAGLLEPTEGTILFDRVDLRTTLYRDVRRQIGLVLQENHLFSSTILRNIAFGELEPDFDRVVHAAQLANAHDFISRLPLGYETPIGESGLLLSGGQKQRICIARALYHDPPILIFDEATSALDAESERAIQDNLRRVMANRTSLVIAHRLSTIRDADQIVVLERGRMVESGTHDELMARRGLYFYLSSQQLGL